MPYGLTTHRLLRNAKIPLFSSGDTSGGYIGHTFSKVLSTVSCYSTRTRPPTFQNFFLCSQTFSPLASSAPSHGCCRSLLPLKFVSFVFTWISFAYTKCTHTNTHIRTGQIDLGVIWVYTHIHTLSLSLSLTHTHTHIHT
jgi:hypothetical protein